MVVTIFILGSQPWYRRPVFCCGYPRSGYYVESFGVFNAFASSTMRVQGRTFRAAAVRLRGGTVRAFSPASCTTSESSPRASAIHRGMAGLSKRLYVVRALVFGLAREWAPAP